MLVILDVYLFMENETEMFLKYTVSKMCQTIVFLFLIWN